MEDSTQNLPEDTSFHRDTDLISARVISGTLTKQHTEDEEECRQGPTRKTGVDPLQVANAATIQAGTPQPQVHKAVKGAAGGAPAGAACWDNR